ncbi:hypothetical protein PIB30_037279 [Stylosanthes scabra]|uniref:Uncharacterized protein n=1 Tax=Stylosanthes scabra TaxID=79078 RepID=A0ABU6VF76_9FABA|nr:hypothetical protein [Stylosanthes scabra]
MKKVFLKPTILATSNNRSSSAFDKLGLGGRDPNPFGGIGSDESRITQELRHRMQAMELEVRELRKENVELKNATKDLRSRRRSLMSAPLEASQQD